MPQFDVFENPGRRRTQVPFLVSLQSARYDKADTRLLAPLVPLVTSRATAEWLAPRFTILDQMVVLDVFGLITVPFARLGAPVATLADEKSRTKLVRALDELLSQA